LASGSIFALDLEMRPEDHEEEYKIRDILKDDTELQQIGTCGSLVRVGKQGCTACLINELCQNEEDPFSIGTEEFTWTMKVKMSLPIYKTETIPGLIRQKRAPTQCKIQRPYKI
jgi:hypothetical protein